MILNTKSHSVSLLISETKVTPFNSESPFHLVALFQEFQANCKMVQIRSKKNNLVLHYGLTNFNLCDLILFLNLKLMVLVALALCESKVNQVHNNVACC